MIDWETLLKHNRVKAIGIPWTEEELNAIYNLKIPVEKVREGILTLEDLKKEGNQTRKSLFSMTKEELMQLAKKEGIEFDATVVTRGELIGILSQKYAKSTKESKQREQKGKKSIRVSKKK